MRTEINIKFTEDDYMLPVDDFCKKYKCTPRRKLIKDYGQMWQHKVDYSVIFFKTRMFILNKDIVKIKQYASEDHENQRVSNRKNTLAKKREEYCKKNKCINLTALARECGVKGQIHKIPGIKYWNKWNTSFISLDDADIYKEYFSLPSSKRQKFIEALRDSRLEQQGYIHISKVTDKYGSFWRNTKLVPTTTIDGRCYVKQEDIAKIEKNYKERMKQKEVRDKKKAEPLLTEKIQQFCEENDCITLNEATKKYGYVWQKCKELEFVYFEGRRLIKKDQLYLLEERAMTPKDYCKKYDCTEVKDLINKYGQGWRRQNVVPIIKWKKNFAFVKNSDIPKIKEYATSTNGEHVVQTKKEKRKKFIEENNCVRVDELLKKYGQSWYKNKIVPIETYNAVTIVSKENIKLIEDYYRGHNKMTAGEHSRETYMKKVKEFCITNDCTPLWKIKLKYGNIRCLNSLITGTLSYDKRTKFIKNSDIPKIEEYTKNRNPFISKAEKEVVKFIQTIYKGEIDENNRKLIRPQEVDIYLPEIKLAIEFNGTYWHSTKYVDKDFHKNKSIACLEKGVRLIHIYEFDWNEPARQKIIKEQLKVALSPSYAKNAKCATKIVPWKEAKDFYNKYVAAEYNFDIGLNIGLYSKKKLSAMITLVEKDDGWYIENFICAPGFYTKATFTKLYTYFIRKTKPQTLYFNCDRDIHDTRIFDKTDYVSKQEKDNPFYIGIDGNVYNKTIEDPKLTIYRSGRIMYKYV